MQFSKVSAYFYAIQELHQSMDKVLLQNTFQSSVPPINAVFRLIKFLSRLKPFIENSISVILTLKNIRAILELK